MHRIRLRKYFRNKTHIFSGTDGFLFLFSLTFTQAYIDMDNHEYRAGYGLEIHLGYDENTAT